MLGPLKKHHLNHTFHKLRIWDAEAADRPDVLIANSEEVRRRIELYWRRESVVIHPPIEDFWLEQDFTPGAMEHPDYYLIVSTLTPYKRIDLAIEACNRSKRHLKIVGEGPDRKRLESMAGETIEFYGRREDEELGDLMTGARALLFPGLDDFGLVPVEAMACGTPVIAYGKGGALETVQEGVTGEFFHVPDAADLLSVLEKFEQNMYSKEDCVSRASRFAKEPFIKRMHEEIDRLMRR